MPSIQETIRSLLGADPALADLVGDRIFPGQVPDLEDPTPWLYYAVPETVPAEQLGGGGAARHQVEVHALADSYATAKAIVDAVKAALNAFTGGQVVQSLWVGTAEEVTEEGYHHVARFDVWAVEALVLAAAGAQSRITTGVGSITLEACDRVLALDCSGLTLDGVPLGGAPDLSDYARLSQPNTFAAGQTVAADGWALTQDVPEDSSGGLRFLRAGQPRAALEVPTDELRVSLDTEWSAGVDLGPTATTVRAAAQPPPGEPAGADLYLQAGHGPGLGSGGPGGDVRVMTGVGTTHGSLRVRVGDLADRLVVGPAGVTVAGLLAAGGGLAGDGSGLTGLSASALASGTVPAARLPSVVARRDAANAYTAAQSVAADTDGHPPLLDLTSTDLAGVVIRVNRGEGTPVFEVDAGGGVACGGLTAGGTIAGDGSGLTSLDASAISSGTLGDARLGPNVPLKDSANAFTAPQSIAHAANAVGLTVQGSSSQSSDYQQWKNGAGTVVARVAPFTDSFAMVVASTFATPLENMEFNCRATAGALRLNSTSVVVWTANSVSWSAADTGIARAAAGVVRVTNGSTGLGHLRCSQIHTDTITADNVSSLSQTHRLPIYDASGTLVGFIPVYTVP